MTAIAVVAEGLGDVQALPSLIAKTAQQFGEQIYAVNMVRAGGWLKLKQVGQLERYCKLAASRTDIELVLIVADLDDGCAKEEVEIISSRLTAISDQIRVPVRLCLCIREYEAWFLQSMDQFQVAFPDISWPVDGERRSPEMIRGAKEAFEKIIGSKYRETVDQLKYTKFIDPISLYNNSRSFRKFCKGLIGKNYSELDLAVSFYGIRGISRNVF